eukprot:TRINITY_DN32711_c0_g1_i1.p1 TRINITY_DN32711_c0_g1~~TRINITY_DN32711_c0_g1_i1.p1  ORF type:complete len:191 (+),score=47.59 TRINITY_DN32711_c0_g1_i1:169-741(+)
MSVIGGLKPFGATYLVYNDGDVLGLLGCVASLVPYVAAVFLAAWFVATRAKGCLDAALCVVTCDVVNVLLKNVIREPRPPMGGAIREDFGMPSRHAQFTACICVLAMLCVPKGKQTPLFPLVMWTAVFAVSAARVYLGYHTLQQVGVGCVVGCLYAVWWNTLASKGLAKLGITPALHKLANGVINLVIHR